MFMKKVFYLKIIIVLLIVFNAVTFSYFYKQDEADYCFLEDNSNYVLVEKNALGEGITSYLYKDNQDSFLSKIYKDNKEIAINELIKEDKVKEFNLKIEELLNLKYPQFIVEGLTKDEVVKSYLLRENEMVIYFSNYNITPSLNELLYLKVNYNEIRDYLNFTLVLDKEYQNESGYNYTNAKKSVAFTFDDSPNKNKTNKILDYLEDNLFHATFFVLGSKMKYQKDLILSIKARGNEIGSHTYNHQNMKTMKEEDIINDFNLMNDLYKSITNEDLKLVRPPYGSINNSDLSLIDASFILWNKDTNDWKVRNSNKIINYVLNNIKDGDIILFHDSYNETVKAIEELLPILYSKGYQVMSVSELMKLKGINLESHQIYRSAKG